MQPRRRGLSSDDQERPALPQTVPTDAASPCCTTTGSLERVYGLSLRYKRTRKTHELHREAWPISAHAYSYTRAGIAVRYAPRVCTLVLFIVVVKFDCNSREIIGE